ncbi:MAG TPA: PD-(D/E)XK nuclease family protein, partial [Bacteroidales bacterium]|nr:PD-(D/E)XK nuclease family protein [Bacteroidales bacterium]
PKVSITHCDFNFDSHQTSFTEEITIQKREEVLNRIYQKAASGFSPSSLAHYLECPLKFYLSDILRLQASAQFDESIKLNELGTIVHETLELLYKPYVGKRLDEKMLDQIVSRSREVLESSIQNLIPGGLADLGNSLITKEVAYQFVSNFLWHEKQNLHPARPVQIKKLEHPVETSYTLNNINVKIKGTIDRIDQHGQDYRLIDYKTGQVKDADLKLKTWDDLLNRKKTKALQLALYWLLVSRSDLSYAQADFVCGIISLQKAGSGMFNLQLPDSSGHNESLHQIEQQLSRLVEEILDPDLPIIQTDDRSYCKNCDFVNICNR